MTVLIVSWIFSKSKKVENPLLQEQVNPAPKIKIRATHASNSGSVTYPGHTPMIFPIEEHTSRPVKVIRRETHITEEEIPDRYVGRETSKNKKRYQILNEEIKKTGISKIANFYF
ncbi:MAG: hypothetical protein WC055_06610 [Melioribacteraceae bacterium]